MGVGLFAGKNRTFNVGIKTNHYSNGNIFTQNAGVKIPLTLSLGYAFWAANPPPKASCVLRRSSGNA